VTITMPDTMPSILISYSRANREFVQTLYKRLKEMKFNLWRDLHDIPDGEPFWEEIKKGIDASDNIVLCMSPAALDSKWVQKEWQYARQQGKRVIPVIVEEVDFDNVPRWMSRISWKDVRKDVPEHETLWDNFITTLNTPYDGRKVPFMVDRLPDYFINRPAEFEKLVDALVDSNGAVAITAAVKGAGGFGKTTLATALCHDTRVRGAFDDGILWVTLGETPSDADLIRYALDLCYEMTGERPNVETKTAVKAELQKAIGDRYMLLVIDDLWRKSDADIFLTDSPNSAVLVTTRYDHTLPDATNFTQNVDAMAMDEAVALLAWGIDHDDSHQAELEALAQRLGEWAVILRLTNATLRNRIGRGNSVEDALAYANKALTRRGLTAFDNDDESERSGAVKATIEVSLDLLDDERQAQFARLAIFPEDVDIPFSTLERLWDLDDFDTEETAEALQDAGLFAAYSLDTNTIRLHDVVRQYLQETHADHLTTWHQGLVENYGDLTQLPDTYAWRNIAFHLMYADQLPTLRDLLLNFGYLQNKLNATDPNALIADCDYLPDDRAIQLVQSAIRMSSHITIKDNLRLGEGLGKHLAGYQYDNDNIKRLFTSIENNKTHQFIPTSQTLAFPAGGALQRTLSGHTDGVLSVVLSDDYAISASSDRTLKVWNWTTGELERTLEGHTDAVASVSLSGDYAISASYDNTLKVWNWTEGELERTLEGHTDAVASVALSGDYAISASYDNTLKVWNWQTGEMLRTLEGHTHWVNSVAVSGDYAISASLDHTLKVWNWQTGEMLRTLEGHTDAVASVSLSGDYAISASLDHTLKVWNWTAGELERTLSDHTDAVLSVALLGEYAISASYDNTLKVWNWQTGEMLRTLEEHMDAVWSVSLSGEYAISASDDGTLKVWNWTAGELERTLEEHTASVTSVVLSGDYAISASSDRTLKVWNWQTSEMLRTLEGHTDAVLSVALLGEHAISASVDHTLKVWNWTAGELERTLSGHTYGVFSVVLSGEYAISASNDHTLKVWNWTAGELERTLSGHTNTVLSVALSGEYAISASRDNALKVWNWMTGELECTLEGHTAPVTSVVLSGDYAISASSDHTLKVWNWTAGELERTLSDHTDAVLSVALSGDYAISASVDHALKVWNWQKGELIATFYADSQQYAVAIAPDASVVVCGGQSGQVHFLRPNAALRRLLLGSH
jgi:WD40 repeat protein